MGGLTFNIGSLGMFADMMASGIARNNATGQAGKFGEIAQKLEGKGILEINIGSNGITGKFGMGGFDLAGSLYTFGKRMSDKASLKSYAMQERVSKEEAETAYWGYVYGDWTQENTMARICSRRDELHIVDDMADGANAQTVQKADGNGRVITMKNTGDVHKNAITLGHESYRDGIVGNKAEQQRETFNAVVGHAGMAARMDDYGTQFDGLLGDEVEAYKKGDMTALMMDSLYNYSSDADYWKIVMNADGSHNFLFDGKKTLSIDYMDENGKLISTSEPDIDTQNKMMNGVGMAEYLTKVLGKERVLELLKQNGIDVKSVDDIPDDVLASVLGISEDTVKVMPDSAKAQAFESKKDAMIGELLMNKMGASWDPNAKNVNGGTGSWVNTDGINFTITDSTYNGNIMAEIQNGNYLYSAVSATLFREPDSWNSVTSSDGKNWNKNVENWNKDNILYEKTGLNWDYYDSLLVEKYQSVDNLTGTDYNQPFYDFASQQWIQGNTVNSNFYMGYYTDGQEKSYKYTDSTKTTTELKYENDVLVLNSSSTISGISIGKYGGENNSRSDRWLGHDTSKKNSNDTWTDYTYEDSNGKDIITGYSDGCFITTRPNQAMLLNRLRNNWKFTNGIQIRGTIVNDSYSNYLSRYPYTIRGYKYYE